MKGYLQKVLFIFTGLYSIVNFGWIISGFYLMSNSPVQTKVFSIQGFLIWLGCLAIGLACTAFLTYPVHDALRKMEEGTLEDRDLEFVSVRNRRLPYYLSMVLVGLIILFDAVVYVFYREYHIGPIASSGLWITSIAADLGLPVCLYSGLSIVTYPVFNSIYREFQIRSLPFSHDDLRLGTKIVCLFCIVCIGVIIWMAMIGFYEGLSRIREEMQENMLAFERYVSQEIAPMGNAVTAEELKPVIDRIASSGLGKPFLMSRMGEQLYNPSRVDVFTGSWEDIDRSIRDAVRSGNPQTMYENIHERSLCFIPAGSNLTIGIASDLGSRLPRFSQFYLVTGLLSLFVFGTVGFAVVALLMIFVNPVCRTVENLDDLSSGEGDLTARLVVHSNDEMGELASRFNAFVGRLDEIVTDVKKAAGDVDKSSHEVSSNADSLMFSLQELTSAVEMVAQAIQSMTTSIKHSAASAEHGRDRTRNMVKMANSSEESMRSLVTAMEDISRSSKKIGDIISTVNEVAFQTNLLALNAAVEAARAGEHGKGFAIVAEEVRALARRSSAASLEIRQLIEDTVKKIRTGDQMAKSTSESIAGIISEINDISGTIEEFAAVSSHQSGSVDDLNKAVFQIDSVTQKNVATIGELAGSADNMLSAASRLAGGVDRFKVS